MRIASIHRPDHDYPSRPQLWVSRFDPKQDNEDLWHDLWAHFLQCGDISWVTVHASAAAGCKHAYIAFVDDNDFQKGLDLDGSFMNGRKLAVQIAHTSRRQLGL